MSRYGTPVAYYAVQAAGQQHVDRIVGLYVTAPRPILADPDGELTCGSCARTVGPGFTPSGLAGLAARRFEPFFAADDDPKPLCVGCFASIDQDVWETEK